MEEETNCHKCYNCGFYSPYYIKGDIRFNKAEEGLCRTKRTRVNSHDGCEKFIGVNYRSKNYKKSVAEKALVQILSQLSELRQIIEEAQADE